jgi:glycerate 2-kinase
MMRQDALTIFNAAVEAVDPYRAVRLNVEVDGDELVVATAGGAVRLPLPKAGRGRVLVVGAGKGTAPMAQALEEILGDRLDQGIICVKDGHGLDLGRVEVLEASHPVPDERGVKAGERILELVAGAGADDLVIGALSGGGSALLTLPLVGVALDDLAALTDMLLASGAEIGEINALRKHLSQVKGGRLAAAAAPARVVNLALSDVIGDRLDVIASGPFTADPSTFADGWGVVERYGLADKIPPSVVKCLKAGVAGEIPETPKPGDEKVDSVVHSVVGSNRKSLDAAADKARLLGYTPIILSSVLEGEAREAAGFLAAVAIEALERGDPIAPPACILTGGETTVTIRGQGKGGRNQELALALAAHIEGMDGVVALSGGTDGNDGPTDAAGGLVDGSTVERGRQAGLDLDETLSRNDSYHYLDRVGDLVRTGPTRTNVMDVQLLLVRP